jgi:hypothetical protein
MAKMFYTIEEVAKKLGKSEEQVKDMAKSGQLQEFRDRDRLMFKVEQVDMLAGGEDDTGDIQLSLEDSAVGGSSVGMTGSGLDIKGESSIGLADSREGTGISVFDTGHGEEEASDATHAGESVGEELSLEAVGSGSGLLDLTRESDETSLGAALLEQVYSSDDEAEVPAHASGLFEAAGADSPGAVMGAVPGAMPVLIEVYDGGGSGLGAGLMIGAFIALICLAIVAIVGVSGATPGLAMTLASNVWVWFGALLGVTLILGGVGFFIGKASE